MMTEKDIKEIKEKAMRRAMRTAVLKKVSELRSSACLPDTFDTGDVETLMAEQHMLLKELKMLNDDWYGP